MKNLITELRRRRVPRALALYLASGWLVIEVADTTFLRLGLPDWSVTFVLILVLVGLPIVMVLSWFYDLTGSGLRAAGGPPGSEPADSELGDAAAARRGPGTGAVLVAVAILVLVAAVLSGISHGSREQPAADRVMVVPLVDRSGSPGLEQVGAIAADWITSWLGETRVVEVIPTVSVMRTIGDDAGARSAAELERLAGESGVGTLVTGSYFQQGDSVHFQVQVIDVGSSEVLGVVDDVSAPIKRPLEGIERLRDRIGALLAAHLNPRLAGFRVGKPPPSYESYRAAAEGYEFVADSRWAAAAKRFERAAALDSTYVQAHLMAAMTNLNNGNRAVADSMISALAASQLDLTRGEGAFLAFQRALLDRDPEELWRAAIEKAEALPAPVAHYDVALVALWLNRPEDALRALDRVTFDRGWMADWAGSYWSVRTAALHRLGRHDDELRAIERAREEWRVEHGRVREYRLRTLAAAGRTEDVRALLEAARANDPERFAELALVAALELTAHGAPERGAAVARDGLQALQEVEHSPPEVRRLQARLLMAAGRWTDARDSYAELAAEHPDQYWLLGRQGAAAGLSGDSAEARRIENRLADLEIPYDPGGPTLQRALIAAALADTTRAVRLLRDAHENGAWFTTSLHRDPALKRIRGSPALNAFFSPGDMSE